MKDYIKPAERLSFTTNKNILKKIFSFMTVTIIGLIHLSKIINPQEIYNVAITTSC